MKDIMTLRKAIEEKHILIGTIIPYIPDNGEIQVGSIKTGTKGRKQKFKTCELFWKLIEFKSGQFALIPFESTNMNLTLSGKIGAKESKKTLNNICSRLWSSSLLGLEAKNLSKKEFESLPQKIKAEFKNIWLGNPETIKKGEETIDLVYYANEYGYCKKHILYSKTLGDSKKTAELKPVIYLPDKILIDISTKTLYKDSNQLAKNRLSIVIDRFEEGKETTVTEETILELKEILKNM